MQDKHKGRARRTFDPHTTRRLIRTIWQQYPLQFCLILVLIFINAVVTIGLFMFIRTLIDDYITPMMLSGAPDFGPLALAMRNLVLMAIIGVLAGFFYRRLAGVIAQGVIRNIRDDMFAHMQSLPVKYFDSHQYGETMNYFTSDVDTLRQMLSQSIPMMFSSAVQCVFAFFGMLATNVFLTLFVLVLLVFILMALRGISGNSGKFFVKQQMAVADINAYIEEMIEGQKVIKVFCHEDAAKEQFDSLNDTLCENATKANQYANILMPIMGNLSNLQYVLLAIVGGYMALSGIGGLTVGIIAAFLQLSKSFTLPMAQMTQQLNMVYLALAGAERIFGFLSEQPEVDNGYVTLVRAQETKNGLTEAANDASGAVWAWKHPHSDGTTTLATLTGEVRFFDVDFGYTSDTIVLHDISMYAEPGQKVAFVGATGAGKTTITNLINRFYDIADGKIRYDDININKIKKSDLRRSLGMVLQDTHLFTGTIADNIRYGNLSATSEQVKDAAKLAGAHSFIMRLPNGYDTEISGAGENLSQGQRQLLSIARAAVANPPVMILDEATSSIDTRTEAIVQRGMDALMHGRTVFVIAHRLSTVQNADVIMVLEHGRIIERGNHEQLIAQKGQYYDLYRGTLELE